MSQKIVTLRGIPLPEPGQPMPDVVEKLEWLLEAARSGEIQGLVVVYLYSDGGCGSSMRGKVNYSTIGHLEETKLRLLDELRKE